MGGPSNTGGNTGSDEGFFNSERERKRLPVAVAPDIVHVPEQARSAPPIAHMTKGNKPKS